MSNLRVGNGDDFPEAAEKMLLDAKALHAARRYDGAAYLAGYVAECSLKTILLIELLARQTGAATTTQLALALSRETAWQTALPDYVALLKRKISHDVGKALRVATGGTTEPTLPACGAVSQPYVRAIRPTLRVLDWDPFHRYRAPGGVGARQARLRVWGAERIISLSLRTMRCDGLVR